MRIQDRRYTTTDFSPPLGEQTVSVLNHRNVGNSVAPDHTQGRYTYPDRKNRSMIFPDGRPMWTTLQVNGLARKMTTYQTPKGKVFVSPSSSVPQSQEQFMLARRMYIYGGKVITE